MCNEVELLCTSKLDMAISISEIKCHMGPVAYIMSISIVLKGLVTRSYRQGRHDVASSSSSRFGHNLRRNWYRARRNQAHLTCLNQKSLIQYTVILYDSSMITRAYLTYVLIESGSGSEYVLAYH